MELKKKEGTSNKILFTNIGKLQDNLLKLINNIREKPGDYLENLRKENPEPSDQMNLLLKFLYSIKNKKFPPIKKNNDVCKCSEDILSYIILYDEGKNEINFGNNDKSNYTLKRRLERIGIKKVENQEFIIFGFDEPNSIILDLLLNDPNKEKLFDPKLILGGITCGILPSDRLCTIIDIVEEEKIIFDSFRKKNIYSTHTTDYIHNPKIDFFYDSNELENNENKRKFKNFSFSSEKKIPSAYIRGGKVKTLNINFQSLAKPLLYSNQRKNQNTNIENIMNKNELERKEKPINTFLTKTNDFYKSNNTSNNYIGYKSSTYKYQINPNNNRTPYSNKTFNLLGKRNYSSSNIRSPNPIYYDTYSCNLNNNNNLFSKNICSNCGANLSNNYRKYNMISDSNNMENRKTLKYQNSAKSIFSRNCGEEADVTYYRSFIPDIDGKYINVLTRNTQFKDGCKLIEYETN